MGWSGGAAGGRDGTRGTVVTSWNLRTRACHVVGRPNAPSGSTPAPPLAPARAARVAFETTAPDDDRQPDAREPSRPRRLSARRCARECRSGRQR